RRCRNAIPGASSRRGVWPSSTRSGKSQIRRRSGGPERVTPTDRAAATAWMSYNRRVNALQHFHPAVQAWFAASLAEPTPAQGAGGPVLARGESALVLARTGSGKPLAAFLSCIDRLMSAPAPDRRARCRVLYVSPLKALAVDVERNLRTP